jgi:hypothetical protein
MDALVVVAPLLMVEPGPGESVGEGSWVLAERVMPVPVPLGLGEFCILGRIHSGPNCILEDDMSGRLRLEAGLDVDSFGVGGGKFEFAGSKGSISLIGLVLRYKQRGRCSNSKQGGCVDRGGG